MKLILLYIKMESTPNTPQLPENEIRVSFKTDVKNAIERIEKAFENIKIT